MKRYLLLLTLPSAALALERTASMPDGAALGSSARLNLPVCHPAQALTVRNGKFACMDVQPNILIVGSCTTTKAGNIYQAEVLCPTGFNLLACSGGSHRGSNNSNMQMLEPFSSNDRMGCRSKANTPFGGSSNTVYAHCQGQPVKTARYEIQTPSGCTTPSTGDGWYPGGGEPGDAGGGGGDGADGGGGDGG